MDHKPLESLNKCQLRTMNRLKENLEYYNFKVEYLKGPSNAVSDFLSRNTFAAIEIVGGQPLQKLQEQDRQIRDIKLYLAAKILPGGETKQYLQWIQRIAKKCYIQDDIVMVHIQKSGERDKHAIYCPNSLRAKALHDSHVKEDSGHNGSLKLAHRIINTFWWPGVYNQAEN